MIGQGVDYSETQKKKHTLETCVVKGANSVIGIGQFERYINNYRVFCKTNMLYRL